MTLPIVFYRKTKPEVNSWARWFVHRTLKKNNNNLVSVVGKTGSGKTWSAISICEIMSKMDGVPFTIDHIVFSLMELMELINSGKLVRGSKIVFDEPQVSISAREFQSEANKVFNYLLSTFRHRNLSLFFCTPFENLLDKSTRRLFHVKIETEGVDLKTMSCRLKPRALEYTDFKDEPYRKRLVINTMDGSYQVSYWDVPKPSEELIEQYEKKKLDFTTRLNENIMARLKKHEEKGKSMTGYAVDNPELTERQKQIYDLHLKGVSGGDIGKKLNISRQAVFLTLVTIQKKGFMVKKEQKMGSTPLKGSNVPKMLPMST